MKIDKSMRLDRLPNGDYLYEKEINIDEEIVIDLDDRIVFRNNVITKKSITSNVKIICDKSIEAGNGIKAGWGIKAGNGIEAGWGIEAGNGIKAGWGIEAGNGVIAGFSINAQYIDARLNIFAGTYINRTLDEEEKEINVEEIKNGNVAYGKLNIVKRKFKVGDRIKGNAKADGKYLFTDSRYIGYVIKSYHNTIVVSEDKEGKHSAYEVNAECFDLYEEETKEMTVKQISEALGYDVKIVKEED